MDRYCALFEDLNVTSLREVDKTVGVCSSGPKEQVLAVLKVIKVFRLRFQEYMHIVTVDNFVVQLSKEILQEMVSQIPNSQDSHSEKSIEELAKTAGDYLKTLNLSKS